MSRCAVLLPGAWYATSAPLLWYAREAAKARGWEIVEQRELLGRTAQDPFEWAVEKAELAIGEARGADTVAVIGKSLASAAAGLVAALRFPAVWLTPLLTEDRVIDDLGRASAPTLLVGSRADQTWDAARIPDNPHIEVFELDGLDHSLEVPGDPLASADALKTVTERVGAFFDRL
jgi:predicted alpha/beta-hydrolase family hydrolase